MMDSVYIYPVKKNVLAFAKITMHEKLWVWIYFFQNQKGHNETFVLCGCFSLKFNWVAFYPKSSSASAPSQALGGACFLYNALCFRSGLLCGAEDGTQSPMHARQLSHRAAA